MDIAQPYLSKITSASFAPLLSSDIRSISVLQITNPSLLDNTGAPTQSGLYDPRLGPFQTRDICRTCRLSNTQCPGHFGHIELNVPVFHPLFMTHAFHLLRGTCFHCHHFLASEIIIVRYAAKLKLLNHGLLLESDAVDDFPTIKLSNVKAGKRGIDETEEGLSQEEEEEDKEFDLPYYKATLKKFVEECIEKQIRKESKTSKDNYKIGMCFDKRKKIISELIKLLPKKRCERCRAYACRMRKDGHTKIMEFSLASKQADIHRAMELHRPDVLALARRNSNQIYEGEDEGAMDLDTPNDTASGTKKKQVERMILAEEARAHLRLLFQNESEICDLLYDTHGPAMQKENQSNSSATADMFFLDVIAVPPTKFRPAAVMGGQTLEAPQNLLLGAILMQTVKIRDLNEKLAAVSEKPPNGALAQALLIVQKEQQKKLYSQILEGCIGMQIAVNSLLDSNRNPTVMAKGKLPPQGVKQILEKKEGLFRMNMMGKRVNYAARSVISPDINIETNEIGVPPVFAKKLTFPEFVTAHNFDKMHKLVCNGPHVHPGAVFVEDDDGTMVALDRMDGESRKALANTLLQTSSNADRSNKNPRPDIGLPPTRTPMIGKRVHRHLDDGDILILNRQPTLHKPSMMCHRARILKGEKTIRMHYANCNSYNADFDGDEMNMHFPQNLIAQSEARTIANNDNQYLVPTSGNPLRGLIQDHVVSGVWMTNKDTFFSREDYYQIIYGALRPENEYTGGGQVLTVSPAIWKPRPLWTGKQIISTILKNITPTNAAGLYLTSSAKVSGKNWGIHSSEDTVQFDAGYMISGVIDKSQIGASPYGLVHSVHDLYGAEVAGRLLSIFSRLFTKYLQHRAFTCRMDDLFLTGHGNAIRSRLLNETSVRGRRATLSMVGLSEEEVSTPQGKKDLQARLEEVLRDDMKMAALDNSYNVETSELKTKIDNQCLPAGLYKPFPWNNMQMMTGSGAKGTTVNASQISCLLGQQALEGRRVPVMVSGKTLPSFKAFETAPRAGGFVAQRFLTGIRPQEYYFHCMAGREGLIDTAVKTSRSGYLQRCLIKHLEGIRVHYDHTVRNSDSSVIQFHYGDDSLDVTKQKHLYQFEFSLLNRASLIERYQPTEILGRLDGETATNHADSIIKAKKSGTNQSLPLPTMSIYSPTLYFGSTSEKFTEAVNKYKVENPKRLLRVKKKYRADWPAYVNSNELIPTDFFRSLMQIRFMKGIVDPGEAVGLLASQGVGEPSTQMTLNTFHFAGHGAANVTLGIPRLREIVMTASTKIKTPTMKFPIKAEVTAEEFAKFLKRTTRVTLSQVVDEVIVKETLTSKTQNGERFKSYTVKLQFYPSDEYCAEYSITVEAVFKSVVRAFIPLLERRIKAEFKTRALDIKNQFATIGKGKSIAARTGTTGEDGDGEDVNEDVPVRRVDEADIEDGDADDQRRARQKHEVDYDQDSSDGSENGVGGLNDKRLREITDLEDGESDDETDSMADSDEEKEQEIKERRANVFLKLKEEVESDSSYVTTIEFDEEKGNSCEFTMNFSSTSHKLLLIGIIEKCCQSAVIQEIPGIGRALSAQSDKPHQDKSQYCVTEGANLKAAWSFGYEIIEMNQLYSNDISAILRTYGVEAARAAIIREMSGVFGVYGIGVDYRHLTVIADYMTSEGGYKAFNRPGLANHVSPFLKASYETTTTFLTDATIFGDFDDLMSPSASIVMGQAPRCGTNSFDLLVETKT
ncbi:uncharacterized protein MELLADRAFT_75289 [Melampsora larici-populina 98AG31]|uniref:DNA-directed RNA polymerase subunit n=1 Tax=Melampsora larici-populina (strain 98AG31 / pathotype 3-4-7) TaxID=747676 RepID=F4RV64_MELLP|nr:uncharacterized protein MELLADRAFT_75289 [Melampsora larici-populina 98AG31]EGG03566.1 hypothetical protein MELLADRAFT_75289 [Melampsora larici-populina 98AG31]